MSKGQEILNYMYGNSKYVTSEIHPHNLAFLQISEEGREALLQLWRLKINLEKQPENALKILECFRANYSKVLKTAQNRQSIYFGNAVPNISAVEWAYFQNKKDLLAIQCLALTSALFSLLYFSENEKTIHGSIGFAFFQTAFKVCQRIGCVLLTTVFLMYRRGKPELASLWHTSDRETMQKQQYQLEDICHQLLELPIDLQAKQLLEGMLKVRPSYRNVTNRSTL